jgi:hypothetical protein
MKLVDSSLAVKVIGLNYNIRVIEETGGCCMGGSRGRKKWVGLGENSSKASTDGGVSVVTAVEGFSESGSDAEVSDNCQILLEVEKCGGGRKGVVDGLGWRSTRLEMCQIQFPPFWNLMGSWWVIRSILMLTWRVPSYVESAGTERGVGMGEVRSTSGPIPELVIAGVDVETRGEFDPINYGPAHLVNQVSHYKKTWISWRIFKSVIGSPSSP